MKIKAEVHFDDGDILPITLPCKDSFEAMNLLRDVIERDKAKNVIVQSDCEDKCPVCGCVLYKWVNYKFCRLCGQRLKWDTEC